MGAGQNLRSVSRLLLILCLARTVVGYRSAISSEDALNTLLNRQSQCPTSAPVSCSAIDSNLPSDFCCASGSSCISLDSSSSALCCPAGKSCSSIGTINCEMSLQDANNGVASVYTTRLNDNLPQCGNQCCPFGYNCATGSNGNNFCTIIQDKAISSSSSTSTASPTTQTTSTKTTSTHSVSPTTSSRSSTVSPTSTASSTVSGSILPSNSGIDSTQANPQQQKQNPFPPGVFFAGLFPGMLLGAIIVLAWVILTGRHRKPRSAGDDHMEISEPMVNGHPVRLDYARRNTRSWFKPREEQKGTPGLPFDNWKELTPPRENNIPPPVPDRYIPAGPSAQQPRQRMEYPRTPERQVYREAEDDTTEVIRIYSPVSMDRPIPAVPPLRGMKTKRRSRDSGIGSPFVTPQRPGQDTSSIAGDITPIEETHQTLSPTRYDNKPAHTRLAPEQKGVGSRPETTFTDMLREIDFPDPMKDTPQVPRIPKQYK